MIRIESSRLLLSTKCQIHPNEQKRNLAANIHDGHIHMQNAVGTRIHLRYCCSHMGRYKTSVHIPSVFMHSIENATGNKAFPLHHRCSTKVEENATY